MTAYEGELKASVRWVGDSQDAAMPGHAPVA